MKLSIYEHNVTPDTSKMNEYKMVLLNNMLKINGDVIEDKDKIIAVEELLENNKEDIIRLASARVYNSKGGRQKMLSIIFEEDGEIYRIIGNSSLQEMNDLYSRIKNEIEKIIE